MFGLSLFFQQVCFLTGLLSNCSIALFIISLNSLMNSSLSALQLTSDKLSSSSESSWSLLWSGGGSSTTSYCHTFPILLLDTPVTSCLSIDRHLGTCSLVFSGISSTHLSSITVSVTSLTLCASVASPVSFLTVLTLGSNWYLPPLLLLVVHNYPSCFCMLLHIWSYFFICCCWLVYQILPTYFRVHPRSSIDLSLTCFLSLLQCLLLSCTIWY